MMDRQFSVRLTDGQYRHLVKLLESNGCATVPELARKAIFDRWPFEPSSASCTNPGTPQEEKKAEREKSPHTPLKEKGERKEEDETSPNACACAREEELSAAVAEAESIPSLSVDLRKPPTLAEAIAYSRLRFPHITVESIANWHEAMTEQGWIALNGRSIRNWTGVLRKWWKGRHKHERGIRREAALERDVSALEKRVELNEKFNQEREKRLASGTGGNSRYFNGRPKLSNHVNISEEEKNDILGKIGI